MKSTSSVASRRRGQATRLATLLASGTIGATAALLAGCGQKGPLTLPAAPASAASAPAQK